MKLKKGISVFLAVALMFTTIFTVMSFDSSAASDITLSEYGLTIPAADQTNNFVAYGQKPGTDSWVKVGNWGGLRTGMLNNSKKSIANGSGAYEGGTVVVYMMKNVSSTDSQAFDAGLQIDGTYVINLGGNTLTVGDSAARLFGMSTNKSYLNGDTNYHTKIIIENGTINYSKTVVDLYGSADSEYTGNKTAEVIFNNVKFTSQTTGTVNVVQARAPFGTNQTAELDITFNGCTFDYPKAAGINIINDSSDVNADENEAVNIHLDLHGGLVNVKSIDKFNSFKGRGEFDQDNLTKALTFSRYLEDHDLFIPAEDLTTGGTFYAYGQKSGETNWTYINKWGGLRSGLLNNSKKSIANGGGEYEGGKLVAYMTKSVTHTDTDSFDSGLSIDGTYVLDLGGNTLTANNCDRIFGFSTNSSYLSGDTNYKTTFIVENGRIESTQAVIDVFGSANGTYTGDKPIDIIFNNVQFTSSTEGDIILAKARAAFGENQTATLNITFNNCGFKYPKASSVTLVRDSAGNNASGVEAVKTNVTVNGGFISVKNADKFTLFTGQSDNDIAIIDSTVKLYAPTSSAAPSSNTTYLTHTDGTVNSGVEFVFVKTSEKDAVATYELQKKNVNSYVPKTSITLGSELVMNVYLPVANLQKFTLDGVSYENLELLSDTKTTLADGEEYYKLKVLLPAATAARDIELLVTVTFGEDTAKGTFSLGVMKYAEQVLSNGTDVEKILVKDVLSYIKSAYIYFKPEDTETVSKIDSVIGADYNTTAPVVQEGSIEPPSKGLLSVTYALNATPALKFYIDGSAPVESYEFFIGEQKIDGKTGTDAKGTYVILEVYAYAMCETVTYKINGTEMGSYHIASYHNWTTGLENDALVTLVERFWKYCQSARDYRNSVTSN